MIHLTGETLSIAYVLAVAWQQVEVAPMLLKLWFV
jgi:hypothetical protein